MVNWMNMEIEGIEGLCIKVIKISLFINGDVENVVIIIEVGFL